MDNYKFRVLTFDDHIIDWDEMGYGEPGDHRRINEMTVTVHASSAEDAGNKACALTGRGFYEVESVEDEANG